jgi:hypothetical protein
MRTVTLDDYANLLTDMKAAHRQECARRLPVALLFVLLNCYSVTFGEGWLLPLFNLVAMVLCMDILIGDLLDVIEG